MPRSRTPETTRSVFDHEKLLRPVGWIDGQSKSSRTHLAPVEAMASRSRARSVSLSQISGDPGLNPARAPVGVTEAWTIVPLSDVRADCARTDTDGIATRIAAIAAVFRIRVTCAAPP